MNYKTYRNDPCPCGSGNKYKKCCGRIATQGSKEIFYNRYIKYISQHNTGSLLNMVIAAQLLPENHGKNIRFEIIINELLIHQNNGLEPKLSEFFKLLEEVHPSNYLEDLPGNLFTENVLSFGGNFTVMSGIGSYSAEIFQYFFQTINSLMKKLPNSYRIEVLSGITLILELGQLIFNKCGLKPNVFQEGENDLIIANTSNIDLSFVHEDLTELNIPNFIDLNVFQEFICPQDKLKAEYDPDSNPLLYKPFYVINNKYFFLLPSTQLFCINEYIKSVTIKHDLSSLFINEFHSQLYVEIDRSIRRLTWSPTDILKNEEKLQKSYERIFQIDYKILALVVFQPMASFKTIATDSDNKRGEQNHDFYINQRINDIINELGSQSDFTDYRFLTIVLLNELNETSFLFVEESMPNEFRLYFPIYDFFCLTKDSSISAFTFWKFAKVFSAYMQTTDIGPVVSTLDYYSIYKSHRESFYLNDDEGPNFLFVVPETGYSEIRRIYKELDQHGAPYFFEGQLGFINVEKKVDFAPLYYPVIPFERYHVFTNCLQFPLWISNNQVNSEKMESVVENFVNAISFWFSKVADEFKSIYKLNPNIPFTIRLLFDERLFQDLQITEVLDNKEDIFFESKNLENSLQFSIPASLMRLLFSADNKGERILINELFMSLSKNDNFDFADISIDEIIDKIIPLGPSKMMLFVIGDKDRRLINKWRFPSFKVSDAEHGLLLDKLVDSIEYPKPIPRGFISTSEKNEFCHHTVKKLVSYLSIKLHKFDNIELVKLILELYESLIFKREHYKLTFPAQIHCFGNESKIVEKAKHNDIKRIRTTLSLRCLLEFIIHLPPKGTSKASLDDLDELLVVMETIFDYGSLSDAIHLKLDDPMIGLLPSGRIGISKDFYENVLTVYKQETLRNEIQHSLKYFPSFFTDESTQQGDNELVKRINNAFREDWGITLTNYYTILYNLSYIAEDKKVSVVQMAEKEFVELLVKKSGISENEIASCLDLVTLKNNNEVIDKDAGYIDNKYFPWKYNRTTSFLRRPLVLMPSADGDTYFWGLRSVIDSAEFLLQILFEGRLTGGGIEIEKLLGFIRKRNGKFFKDEVYNWFKSNTDLEIISYEVCIAPNGHLVADKNYGDIDILAIDKVYKVVYSIECKQTGEAKIIRDMKQDIDQYFGKDSNPGLIQKHVNRDTWLNDNHHLLKDFVGYNEDFIVKSIIITSNVIPISLLGKPAIPVYDFDSIKREGISIFNYS